MSALPKILIAAACLALPVGAVAQQTLEFQDPVETEQNDDLPMSSLVTNMAENLGRMHYLRTLCFGPQDQVWRDYTRDLIAVEAGSNEDRRRAITRAFNEGYNSEKKRHSACTKAVEIDVASYAETGRRLAVMLGDPYRE